MKDNFDDLSDDFISGDNNNEGEKSNNRKSKNSDREIGIPININNLDGLPSDLPLEIRNIIEALKDIKEHGGNVEDELGLGEADETETKNEDGNTYEKKTWETDWGSVTRLSIGGDFPSDFNKDAIRDMFNKKFGRGFSKVEKEITLENKLEIALEDEDYLEAARLRDEIAKKNKDTENSGNVAPEGDSETSVWDSI